MSSVNPYFVGRQEILYKAKMAMGESTGQTWVVLDI